MRTEQEIMERINEVELAIETRLRALAFESYTIGLGNREIIIEDLKRLKIEKDVLNWVLGVEEEGK